MPLWFLTAFVLVAPASVAPQPPNPTVTPSQANYTPEQCQRDLDTLLTHSDRSYLDARRRLEANPLVSAPAIAARLQGVPPPGPASRNRLMAVLGQFHRPEDLAMFANQLRSTAIDANAKPEDLIPWRALLREQGAAAMPVLTGLVGDRKLDIDVRAIILGDLVEIYPIGQLDALLALVGRGSLPLRRALHLAIRKRATAQASERVQLLAAVDAQLTATDPERLASLIRLRSALTHRPDPAFTAKLIDLAPMPQATGPDFPIQVVALRGLALVGQYDEQAYRHLEKIARAHLAANQRRSQASEILGWLALSGLPPQAAGPIVDQLQLTAAEQPRLAALAYQVGSLPAGPWLGASQQHPWPEVRASAIGRILAPCAGEHVSKLGTIAGLRRGDEDGTVARAAILALGRCRDPDAQRQLKKLLHNQKLDVGRRAAAGWQLVKQHGNPGADEVAKALDQTPDIGMARRLIQVIGRGGLATPTVVESLCDASEITEMAADARASLVRIGASPTCD